MRGLLHTEERELVRILIDMDSIIVNLQGPWLAAYNAEYSDNLTVDKILTWDTHKYVKPECGKHIYDYLKRPGFFYNLEPLPGAIEGVERLKRDGHEIYLVTASPDGGASEKIDWVGKWLPCLDKVKQTVICHDKFIVDGDVLIDDSPRNLVEWKQSHLRSIAMGIKYPYNDHLSPYAFLADSWQDTEKAWRKLYFWVTSLATMRESLR